MIHLKAYDTYPAFAGHNIAGALSICLPAAPGDAAADAVLDLVGGVYGVPARLLMHPRRCRAQVAHARQLAMYLMHTMLSMTLTDVGRYFGRDRTTVAYACSAIEDKRDEAGFDADVAWFEDRIAALVSLHAIAVARRPHVQ